MYAGIINGIVKQYLGDNACTDVISAKLRELCPSLYSLDKAKSSKATELVQSIKNISSSTERASRLNDAMNVSVAFSYGVLFPDGYRLTYQGSSTHKCQIIYCYPHVQSIHPPEKSN